MRGIVVKTQGARVGLQLPIPFTAAAAHQEECNSHRSSQHHCQWHSNGNLCKSGCEYACYGFLLESFLAQRACTTTLTASTMVLLLSLACPFNPAAWFMAWSNCTGDIHVVDDGPGADVLFPLFLFVQLMSLSKHNVLCWEMADTAVLTMVSMTVDVDV